MHDREEYPSEEQTAENVATYLTLPERRNAGNPNKELPRTLGSFLVENRYITGIDMWRGSWGCKYENGTIYLNDRPMSDEQYNYYIFRIGENPATGEQLFTENGDEADQYRFLHETGHAYQQYLMDQECPDNPGDWYNKVVAGSITSTFGKLWKSCYNNRKRDREQGGLSTWGNVPDYNSLPQPSQNAVRALEDANELVTMYLWHPHYLRTFLHYISGQIPGYGETNLREDKLTKITPEAAESLYDGIARYVEAMKLNTNKH